MADFRNQTSFFLWISKTPFSRQFSLIFFWFSTLNKKMSRNICKLRHNVHNGQHLSNESPNFKNVLLLSNFTDNLGHFCTNRRPHYQNSFFSKYIFFSTQNFRMSRNICIWRHKLCNAKTVIGPTFTL